MDEDHKKTVIHDMNTLAQAASPPGKHEACLVVIAGGNVGMMHKLPETGEVFIGRTTDTGIHIDDDGVSRLHARLSITPDRQVMLEDLGSTNGTYVNGVRIVEQILQDGDKVQISPETILRFQHQDAIDEDFQRKLFESAVRDVLTGIYNRKYFLDRIEADFSYSRRHQTPLSLFIFDIDYFKKVNDGYGHPAGDYVLRELATLVKRTIRNEDVLARFGGEEFAVLMRDVDEAKALMLAERLRRLVEQAVFEFQGARIPVTISVGIGTMSTDQTPPMKNSAELVNCADKYLYQAKRTGRNRVASVANDR